jgi:hypothetical protein
MGLYDVNHTTQDRSDPAPNGHDTVASGARLAHNTVSTTYKATGRTSATNRIQQVNGSFVLYDATNTPRVLIGSSPDDGRIGMWVSKPGFSVLTLLGG